MMTMTMRQKNNRAVRDRLLPMPAPTPLTRPPIGRRTGRNNCVIGGRGECNNINGNVGQRQTIAMPAAAVIVMQHQSILCSGSRAGVFAVGGQCVGREGGR